MREGFRFLPDTSGDASFHSVYPLVGGVIARACRHSTLSAQDREDFRCFAWIKLIEKDYRRLRQFRGAGSFRTYLTRVVTRLLMDFRDQLWGKWRPSTTARRLGKVALDLEELTYRDGLSFLEASNVLSGRLSATEDHPYGLFTQLPVRRAMRLVLDNNPVTFVDPAHPSELSRLSRRVGTLLDDAWNTLTKEERTILALRFLSGMKIREIATAMSLEVKPLYSRIQRLLGRLRTELRARNVTMTEVRTLLNDGDTAVLNFELVTTSSQNASLAPVSRALFSPIELLQNLPDRFHRA